jgi:hypothetical protein
MFYVPKILFKVMVVTDFNTRSCSSRSEESPLPQSC